MISFLKKVLNLISLSLKIKLIELKNYLKYQEFSQLQNSNNNNKINVFIDLNFLRSTYDTIGQLIYAKMYSKILKKECNLIIFKDKNHKHKVNTQKEKSFIKNSTILRHHNITFPLLSCIKDFSPNIFVFNEASDGEKYFNAEENLKIPTYATLKKLTTFDNYYLKINELYKNNKIIEYLEAPEYARQYIKYYLNFNKIDQSKGLVTLTLRNSSYTQIRNSNLDSWKKFYIWLEKRGYYPMFINDLEDLKFDSNSLNQFRMVELASSNLHIRLALYEYAKMNCAVASGPTLCLVFSKSPYLLFKTYVNEECSASLDSYEKINGFKFDQWPFAKENQKLIWKQGDHIDLLIDEFIKHENAIN